MLSLPDIRANSLKINTDGHIFAATNGNGVYLSTDNGDSWKQINDGLETGYTLSLAINSGGYIFTGTKGGGVYKSINSTTSLENEEKLPISFALYQNYPNPFGRDIHSHHPSTAIKYTIPNANRVLLTIYNVLGKEVATLVNEEKPAGSYEVSFSAEGLAGGIYFYRLQAGNYSETKKIVLLK
ncbi:MAG: T9SS type A sorting domain-containing protein [Ignavibacteriaceae bacterium]|nr:T9SS type A sorting domain-containing protein [Ignavibacteriaceae bacterium]